MKHQEPSASNYFRITSLVPKLLLTCLFVFLLQISTFGAVFVVTKTADTNDGVCDADCSLREAIAAANASPTDDAILFDIEVFNTKRTILLSSTHLTIQNQGALTINGPGSNLLSINGNNAHRVLVLESGGVLILNDLTVTNGRSTGTINGQFNGGGIHSSGSLTVNNSTVSANWSSSAGAGIFHTGSGLLSVSNSNISSNVLANGTGAGIHSEGMLNIESSTVDGNGSGGFAGGGIYAIGQLSISDSLISGNSATTGAGIRVQNAAFVITNSNISENTGSSSPGISIIQGSGTISDSFISGNVAAQVFGGGIFNSGGPTVVIRTRIFGNQALNSGCGGVCNQSSGQLSVVDSVIENNSSYEGAGVYNQGEMTVLNSLIANNATLGNGQGGGIFNNAFNGGLNLINTTVTGNTSRDGGGLYNFQGPVELNHTTFSFNQATNQAGGVRTGNSTVRVKSSLFGGNTSLVGSGSDILGTIQSEGFNLIQDVNGTIVSGVSIGNIIGRDPQLTLLRDNGGQTSTVALLPTSPAIDAGDPLDFPATDQRGVARSQDGDLDGTSLPDIGAYERQVTQFVVTNTTDESDGTCDSSCSLREAIGAAGVATTQDNAVVFDPALFGAPNQITLLNAELQLFNNGTLWIKGPGSDLLTISGNSQSRVIYNSPGASSAVSSVRIVGGNGQGSVNSGFGGAIYNPSGRFSVDNAVIGNNTAQNGGGIYSGNTGGGTLFLSNSVIRDNSAVSDGGGLFLSGDSSEFIELSTVGNSAENGGGIYLSRGQLMLDRGDISRNFGGGIRVLSNASASLRQSTVSDNTRYGGIINRGELLIENSTVSGNQSVFPGGGIFSQHFATSTLNNTTISRNRSEIHGGGIFNENGPAGVVNLNNATIVFNSTPGIGGGVFNSIDSVVNARNTIIANNSAEIQSPDFERTLNSQGYNLIGNTAGTTITGVTVGNILQQDPRIDPILRLYGGLTPTHALRPGSPAIDFGDPNTFLPTDQRGVARPQDGDGNGNARSDIGAFERRMIDIVKPAPFDFDGDGKTDVAIFRPNAGSGSAEWWWRRSSDGLVPALQFGSSTDVIAPGDFTGDGKMDITIFRPSTGNWFVLRSEDFSFYSFPFGTAGDTPVTGDFDGDGKADPAVFRPSSSQWFIQRSSDNQTQIAAFGIAGDVPVTADYDGDGKDDIAIYRRNGANGGEWWINRSTAGVFAVVFGTATDLTVPGDYTGDGKADIAFFRPSTGEWFVLRSEDLSFYSFPFGANGDIPSPGDYDGDGRIDPAVFRPSNATWFIQGSTSGTQIQQFGTTGDLPVPSSFVR